MALNRIRPYFWNPYSRCGARRHARLDARQNPPIPRWNTDQPSSYLSQLHEAANLEIVDIQNRFVAKDTPLDNKVQRLIADEGHLSKKSDEAKKAHEDAAEKFTKQNPDVPASAVTNRVWAYWLVVVFLLMCEIPFNGTVFQVLREGQLFNYLISAGIGILILLAAHYAGVHLRQKPFGSWTGAVMFIVALTVPVFTVFVIAWLREYYLHARHLVDPMGERIAYYTFLSVNLLMFAVAFYMSWFSHLVGAEELIRTRRLLAKVTKALEKTKSKLRVTRATRLNLHRKSVTRAHQAINGFWQLVHLYADANVRRRRDRDGRNDDRLVTEAVEKSLFLKLPKALEPYYLDYRDPGSAEVRAVGSMTDSNTRASETASAAVHNEGDTAAS